MGDVVDKVRGKDKKQEEAPSTYQRLGLAIEDNENIMREKKRRGSVFNTEGGSGGQEVMNVQSRGTIFGN